MIVNENSQKSNEECETVQQLKEDLNRLTVESMQTRETIQSESTKEMDELRGNLALKEEMHQKAVAEIHNLRSDIASQSDNLRELSAKFMEQQRELAEVKKANVLLRSREINADVQANQKEQEFAELKEENAFLKAQVTEASAENHFSFLI